MSAKLTNLKNKLKNFWNKTTDEDKLYLCIGALVALTALVIILK